MFFAKISVRELFIMYKIHIQFDELTDNSRNVLDSFLSKLEEKEEEEEAKE